ncbi:MAG: hypothetical protein AAF266_07585 [Planctomycetota bacterium]
MTPRRSSTILLVLLGLPLSGCSVFDEAWIVGYFEPELYSDFADEQMSGAAYRALADQVWADLGGDCPESCLAGDYAWGFREGFASYVYAGGSGEPPAVPPRPYWQLDLRNPEGSRAVQSWFEGYRHGARVAREGGYRRTATIKVSASLRDCDACGCPDEPTDVRLPVAEPVEAEPDGPEIVPQPLELVIPHETDIEMAPEEEAEAEPRREPARLPNPSLEASNRENREHTAVPTAMFQISK